MNRDHRVSALSDWHARQVVEVAGDPEGVDLEAHVLGDGAQPPQRVAAPALDLDQRELAASDLDLVLAHDVPVAQRDQRRRAEDHEIELVDDVAEAPFAEVDLPLQPAVLCPGHELLAHVVPLTDRPPRKTRVASRWREHTRPRTRVEEAVCCGRGTAPQGSALSASAATAASPVLTMNTRSPVTST